MRGRESLSMRFSSCLRGSVVTVVTLSTLKTQIELDFLQVNIRYI